MSSSVFSASSAAAASSSAPASSSVLSSSSPSPLSPFALHDAAMMETSGPAGFFSPFASAMQQQQTSPIFSRLAAQRQQQLPAQSQPQAAFAFPQSIHDPSSSSPSSASNGLGYVPFVSAARPAGAPSPLSFGFGIGCSLGGNNERALSQQSSSMASTSSSSSALWAARNMSSTPTAPLLGSASYARPASQQQLKKRRKSISSSSSGEDNNSDDSDSTFRSPKRRGGSPRSTFSKISSQNTMSHNSSNSSSVRQQLPKKMRTGFATSLSLLDDLRTSLPSQHTSVPKQSAASSANFARPPLGASRKMPATHSASPAAQAPAPSPPHPAMRPAKRPAPSSAANASNELSSPSSPNKSLKTSALSQLDLGTLLESMDKSSLLSLLMSLLSTPGQGMDSDILKERVLEKIPVPTLDVALRAIEEKVKDVKKAMPASGREEYVWSRVRAPLAEYARLVCTYLPFFLIGNGKSDTASGNAWNSDLPPVHASTAFKFLSTVTAQVIDFETLLPPVPSSFLSFPEPAWSEATRAYQHNFITSLQAGSNRTASSRQQHAKLSATIPAQLRAPASPDSIFTLLLPALLDAWQAFVQHICDAVNEQGKVFSQEHLQGWFADLERLSTASNTKGEEKEETKFLRHAAGKMGRELFEACGWMLGKEIGQHGHAFRQSSNKRTAGELMQTEEEEQL